MQTHRHTNRHARTHARTHEQDKSGRGKQSTERIAKGRAAPQVGTCAHSAATCPHGRSNLRQFYYFKFECVRLHSMEGLDNSKLAL
eukprot:224243-Amphidinium_carterae.1